MANPHEQDRPLQASATQYKEFLGGAVWADLKGTLVDRLSIVHDELTDLAKAQTLEEIRSLQAEASSIKVFLLYPERLLAEALDNDSRLNEEAPETD